jgi:uncharacterized protein (TIGR02145 family)
MQDFIPIDCLMLKIYDRFNPTSDNSLRSTISLRDRRNNQQYTVRRMQDGRCWMIDNLKLELGFSNPGNTDRDTTVLEPINSDVPANTPIHFTRDTNPNSPRLSGMTGNFTTSGFNTRNGSGNFGNKNDPNADVWRQNDPSGSVYCQGHSPDNIAGSGITLDSIDSKSQCGYLYNLYTATAGSMAQAGYGDDGKYYYNASHSICPAGWQLPSATNPATGSVWTFDNSDIGILSASMEANTLSTPGSQSTSYYRNWYPTGSFRGAASGYWDLSLEDVGKAGYFWSSSDAGEAYGRSVSFGTGYLRPADSVVRYEGRAVRCVALGEYMPAYVPTATPVVKFGGVPATNVVLGGWDDVITATVPPHAAGNVEVTVDNDADPIMTVPGGYTYIAPMTITGITPFSGAVVGGNVVSITGTGFPANPTVVFGSGADAANATNVSVSADGKTITATTPAHNAGVVEVSVVSGAETAKLANAFTYEPTYINISTGTSEVEMHAVFDPALDSTYASGASGTTVATNYTKGYSLSFSTNKPSSDPHARAMKHKNLNSYIANTGNTCLWNDTTKTLTEATSPIGNNTWGFSLSPVNSNWDRQVLCQVPDATHPMKIKSSHSDNGGSSDSTLVYYGIKINRSLAAGTYQARVTYEVVGNI